jgi:large repetitive protein
MRLSSFWLTNWKRKSFQKASLVRKPRRAARALLLEQFEERTLLTTVNWLNPAGGNWGTASNWSGGQLPGAGDTAVISILNAGAAVTHSAGSDTVQSVQASGDLTLLGGTLTVSDTLAMSSNAQLTFQGGTLAQAKVSALSGADVIFTSSGGTLDGVTAGADLDLATNNAAFANIVNGLTLDNSTIHVGNAAGSTFGELFFNTAETLGGTGTVLLGKSNDNLIYSDTGNTLTIGPNITVRGSNGSFGGFQSLINTGTIAADTSGGKAVPGFVNDTGFSGSGGSYFTNEAIDTSAAANPAPQELYQTVRFSDGAFTYTLTGLTANDSYSVRLHFVDLFSTNAGQNRANVTINGTQVLTNFDIDAAAGGAFKALTQTFVTTANSGGQIVVTFDSGGLPGVAQVAGLELLKGGTVLKAIDSGDGGTINILPFSFQNQGNLAVSNSGRLHVSGLSSGLPNVKFRTGSTGAVSFQIASYDGSIPLRVTGTLPTGIVTTFSNNGVVTFSGTPAAGTGGSYALTVISGVTAPLPFALVVEQPPAITSAASTAFLPGVQGSFTVTATGFPAPVISATGALPPGVTFSSAGVLSGTAATASEYHLTVTASNGVNPVATQSFALIVTGPPAITSVSSTTFTTGIAKTFTITTRGGPYPTITKTGALPVGVTFVDNGNGTATFSGTPLVGTRGIYVLTITAANGIGSNYKQTFVLTVNQPPAITSAASTTFTPGIAGSFTVTATGFPAPTFSATGTLPTGVTLSSTGVLSGTPAAGPGGVYNITVTASNGVNPAATQSFALIVTGAPAITSAASTTFTTGIAGTFTITTRGGPYPVLSKTGALPTGVSFVDNGNGTATLSGTPLLGTRGIYVLTITAANGIGSNSTQAFVLTVKQPPAITSVASTTFTPGVQGSFTATATGFPAPTFSATGILPTGVTLSSKGVLSGTPAAGTGGDYSFIVTASNGVSPVATQNFVLTVKGAPTITSVASTTFTTGIAGTFTITTSGSPYPVLSQTGDLPTGVSFVDNGNGTATLSGTPAAGTLGTYALTITAANGFASNATQSFALTVNQPPAITSAVSTTFTPGVQGSFTVTATGFPAPTFSATGALPAGVTLSSTGVLSGTPAAGTGGVYNITVTASNGVNPVATQSFALIVTGAPAITSAASTTFTTEIASTFTITTRGGPYPVLSKTGALPTGVSYVDNGNGTATLSGTPLLGTRGIYVLTITAANGIGSNYKQSFVLTVKQPPAITSVASTTFTPGVQGSFTVTATGFPAPTFSATGTLPTGVTLSSTGVLSGTPAAGPGGVYNITVTASNGVNPAAMQSFALIVTGAPAITSAASTTFTTGIAGTFTITTRGGPYPVLSKTGALPTGVSFVDNGNGTATLSGTPLLGTRGIYVLSITAANGIGSNSTQAFVLTVKQPPAITSVASTTFTPGIAGSFTVKATGFPAPTFSATGILPTGVTLSSTGVLSGTPAAGTGGVYSFIVTASNGVSPVATQSFALTVNGPPAITSVASTTFTTGIAGTFTITTRGGPYPVLSKTGALPPGVSFVDNGNGTATLSGTPAAGTGGVYNFTITAAANGFGSDVTQSFVLTINQPPAITSVAGTTFTPGVQGSFTVTATGFPAPTFSKTGALPTGVTLSSTGVLSGTPAAGTPGVYRILITADNGVDPFATQEFVLKII